MYMYFATNDSDEVIGMSSTMIGNRKEPIDIDEETMNELMINMSGYKIVENKIIKNDLLFLISEKNKKKSELSLSCQEHILNGFDYKINNIEYHFSYDREAQLNMQETFQMFQNDMLKTIIWTVKLDGEHKRLTLDRPLFNLIYTASLQHKQDAISRFRDKLMLILAQAETLEAVKAINWNVLVVEPSPEPVVFNSNNTVNKQIDDVKVSQAQGNIELLQIMFGMGGMF